MEGGRGKRSLRHLARGLPYEKAVKLVLAGDVAVLDDGRAVVASFTDPTRTYAVEHSVCTCQDFPRAPHGFCAHRLAVAMARRAREVTPSQAEASSPAEAVATVAATVASAPLGEAPASVNCHIMLEGRQIQITLRDTNEQRLLARLAAVLRQYPAPAAPQPAPRPQGQDQGWCAIHNVAMQLNEKDGRTWFSHRNPDGDGWCKGRKANR